MDEDNNFIFGMAALLSQLYETFEFESAIMDI